MSQTGSVRLGQRSSRRGEGGSVRLIHTSDWHLGRRFEREDMLEHQATFLDWLFTEAVSRNVDAVIVAGDIYDRSVPPTDAVKLLNKTLTQFARAGIPMVLTSGNHDSAVRLGFGSELSEVSGIHIRTQLSDIARPVVLADEYGELAIYAIPYFRPDAVMAELAADRSHESVLRAATDLIRTDAAARGITRTVVVAHAFITGGSASESERTIRIGGIGDAPARLFDGITYVALGHLHGQQEIRLGDSATVLRYSGSPLAYSFSEKEHRKSVALLEIAGSGNVTSELLDAPVPRRLREVRGTLDELLARADTDLADLSDAWVKVTLTDPKRPHNPMERLRARWPHTLSLFFDPEGGLSDSAADLARLAKTTDPVEVFTMFVEYVANEAPNSDELEVIHDVVETVQRQLVGE